ncbi:glycerophosphodiester phosphodiesterase [Halalkalicoccus salilacus]|uniref:glycerophosphodiester phosphodiesterase n=1 Tax=Halalkalicoccus salilacus TaxID=3117459 RepID=UPI00300F356C
MPTTGSNPKPALIGHRGYAAENPENTIAAVKAAATITNAVEVDIRQCATDELVVFHDKRLSRLTPARGRVSETSYETLRNLKISGSDESIPRLKEVFDAVPADVELVLNLKEPGLADDLLTLSAKYEHDVLISSFHPSILEEIRDLDPTVPTAYLVQESLMNRVLRPALPGLPSWFYVPEDVTDLIEKAVDMGCEAIHPRYELCLQTDLVSQAHTIDLRVEPWTITTKREFEVLKKIGVDAVISDICIGVVN